MFNNKYAQTHGHRYTKEYNIWAHMKGRCCNKKNKDYSKYGAKGINVCERWQNSFENFLKDMGYAPTSKHQIDRIDTLGNYEPNNCRWATIKQQAENRTSSYYWHIEEMVFNSSQEAGNYFKVTPQTIHKWVRGWFDKRRNKYTPPKDNCKTVRRYAND